MRMNDVKTIKRVYTEQSMKVIFKRFFSAGREEYRGRFRYNGGKDSAIVKVTLDLPSLWDEKDDEWSGDEQFELRESFMTLEIEGIHGFSRFEATCTYDPNTGKWESDVLYGFMEDPIVQKTFDILCRKMEIKEVNT